MAKRKKRIDPDDPLKELDKLMRKLVHEQGTVARRNARTSVCSELRRVRSYVDREYPSTTPKKQRRQRKTGQAKVNDLLQKGWEGVTEKQATALAEAGILPKVINVEEIQKVKISGQRKREERRFIRTWTLVPEWAVEMLSHPHCTNSMLSKARRSSTYRKEVLMESRLRRGALTTPKLRLVSATPNVLKQVSNA